jgi:hypothetical protein
MALNVLLVENEVNAGADAARELHDAGHCVLSCHGPDGAAFPCRGVRDPRACPLRSSDVDVVVLVRSGVLAQPSAREDGARCAVMHRIPLVVAGDPVLDPYDEFATRTLSRTYDVVAACELAATAPIDSLSRRATAVLREVAGEAGLPGLRAEVTRRDGRLRVRGYDTDGMTRHERSRAAVHVAMAVRELDPFATGIDVALEAG